MLYKAPENRTTNAEAAAGPLPVAAPLPQAARPINAVAASYVKTPGVGGYVRMMYFNPNHGLTPRSPQSLPLPPAVPAVQPGSAPQGAEGARSFVMPTMPAGVPVLGGKSLPPIAGPGLPPLPLQPMLPFLPAARPDAS